MLGCFDDFSDREGKGPCAIVPLTWKMANQSLCRMIRNGPLKMSKSLKKAENGPLAKTLFPITAIYVALTMFPSYRDLMAQIPKGDTQSVKSKWRDPGLNPNLFAVQTKS